MNFNIIDFYTFISNVDLFEFFTIKRTKFSIFKEIIILRQKNIIYGF